MQKPAAPGHSGRSRWISAAIALALVGQAFAQNVQFRQSSDPAGIVNQSATPASGSTVTTVTAPDTSSTYKFAYWTINGARFTDLSGYSSNPATFVITATTDAVAKYVPTAQDSDTDGLPDWWELRYLGDLAQGASDDPDADAFDNAAEYARGLSPVLANEYGQGGLSRRRGGTLNVDVGVGDATAYYGGVSRRRSLTVAVVLDASRYAVLTESSEPPGAISQTRVVAKGATVNLTTPPDPFAGHRYTGWFVNGARYDQPTQLQPIPITVGADTNAVARYVSQSADTDTDGIADWMEWLLFDSLQYDLNADPDGDGFTLAFEQLRGYSQIAANELGIGGVSRRRSPTVTVDNSGLLLYRLASDPANILDQTQYLVPGTLVTVPDRKGHTYANYRFSWWDLNGARQQDPSGVALTGFDFNIAVPSTVTAHYFDPSVDSVGDGITDWMKMTYYGSLTFGAASDTDGDGFTFAQELFRGHSPRVTDELESGGVSRRKGLLVPMNVGVPDQPPAIGLNLAINLTQTSARLSAQVNPANSPTTVYFQWGLTDQYGQETATQSIGDGPLAVATGADIVSLAPDTTYHFRVIATSALGVSTGGDYTFRTAQPIITIDPPSITSPLAASGRNGTVFSYQITATNSPTAYGAAGLPAGLSLNPTTGVIGGTPTATGVFTVGIAASNAGGTGTAVLTLTVLPPPPGITSPLVVLGTQGAAFTYQITATNNPTSYGATGLPTGLSVDTATGLISGTPTVSGAFNVGISATNAGGTGSDVLTLNIPPSRPVITSALVATAANGSGFSYQIVATNNPTSYGATGLPAGLTVNPTTGLISGTPIVTGPFSVNLSATNLGGTGTATLALTVQSSLPPTITSALTAAATTGLPFSYQIAGSNLPTSFGATGLPPGLSVHTSTGVISGTTTALGSHTVSISATNSTGTGSATLTLLVLPQPPVISSPAIASGKVGQPFSYQITATNSPTSYNVPGLPGGLSVDSVTGLVSGSPTSAGAFNVTLRATNAGGTGLSSLLITIQPPTALTMSLAKTTLVEGETVDGTVSISETLTQDFTVTLGASQASRLTFPATVVIPAGQTSSAFSLVAQQNQAVEAAVNVTLIASGTGAVTAVTASVQILDDDVPAISFTLDHAVASENGGAQATSGTLTLDRAATSPLTAAFSTNIAGQITLPSTITIPANTLSMPVPINMIDNTAVDGNRTVSIVAQLYVGSQNIASAPAVDLTITDDEGPSLVLSFDRTLLVKGQNPAATGTVSVTPVATSALVVALAASDPAKLLVPASVTIPAGQGYVDFPIGAPNDGGAAGTQAVTLTATASPYNQATGSMQITDEQKPDLTVQIIDPPAGGETDGTVNVRLLLVNQGAADAQGPFSQRISVSTDTAAGDDVLLTQVNFSGRLVAGGFVEQILPVRLPLQAGRYWLVAETDAGGAVPEVIETNNIAVSATPVDVAPAYTTTLSIAPETVTSGTAIPITGTATLQGGGVAAFALVNIHVTNAGIVRVVAALTNGSGQFSTTYTPAAGSGGLFQFGASHPGVATASVQDQVTVYALAAAPSALNIEMLESSSQTGSVTVANLSGLPVTGLRTVVSGVPNGVQFTPTLAATALSANGSAKLDYNITSDAPLAGATFTVSLQTNEGASIAVPVNLIVVARRALIVSEPAQLSAAMVPGEQATLALKLKNSGSLRTTPLRILFPAAAPWLTSGSGQAISPIDPGAETIVNLILQPPADLPLTSYFGNLVVVDDGGQGVSIPYNFRAVSNARGGFNVDVVDEFYFFGADSPKVAGATVIVSDLVTGQIVGQGQTGADGRASFPDLRQDYYRVEVSAPGHIINRGSYFVAGGTTTDVQVFISRHLVEYNWRVEQVEVQDRYRVKIDTTFETNVPAPVVTVTPATLDVGDLKLVGQSKQITMKVENHGLIAASAAKFFFGDHPYYKFEPAVEDLGGVPAKSSLLIPLKITRIAGPAPAPPFASAQAFDAPPPPPAVSCSINAGLEWDYICGIIPVARLAIVAVNGVDGDCGGTSPPAPPITPSWPGSPSGPGGPGGGFVPPPITIPAPCICDCKTFFGGSKVCVKFEQSFKVAELMSTLIQRVTAVLPVGAQVTGMEVELGVRGEVCVKCCEKDCASPGMEGKGGGFARATITVVFGRSLTPQFEAPAGSDWVELSVSVTQGFLGVEVKLTGEVNLEGEIDTCVPTYKLCVGGKLGLSAKAGVGVEAEVSAKGTIDGEKFGFSGKVTGEIAVEGMIEGWIRGCLDTGVQAGACADLKLVAQLAGQLTAQPIGRPEVKRGISLGGEIPLGKAGRCFGGDAPGAGGAGAFASPPFAGAFSLPVPPPDNPDAYTVNVPPGDIFTTETEMRAALIPAGSGGVCATVKLSLDQDVVMTRSIFAASLDLKNNADTALSGVAMSISILDAAGVPANDRFAITQTNGVALDGTAGVAARGLIATRHRIVPLDTAAPLAPTTYTVGGTLRYVQDGVQITANLEPVAITVQPDAALFVSYFHQRDVFSDDPFTPQIEPAIPYSLAVMVRNGGAGAANNLSITSGQPKIVDNEKGLLINFRTIATQVAGQNLTPSLTADFGNIAPGQAKIGQWLFTSSLQGLFIDYQATFEHIDDLGDPRTSLIKNVEIHEMIHQVRALGALDDGLPDFLVNDVPDLRDLPDTIHLSGGGSAPVAVVEAGQATGGPMTKTLTATLPTGWAYLRIPDPSNGQYELVRVMRSDGVELPLDVNAWVTDRTFIGMGQRPIYENILHLVDRDSTGSYTLIYQAKLGPDTAAPSSVVKPLAAQSATEFQVNWEGSDDRRLAHYDIYVSIDGGAYQPWLQRTQDLGAIYRGEIGHTYSFQSQATDGAGNVETAHTAADATTQVTSGNVAPTLATIADRQVMEGDTLTVDVSANDPDGRSDLLRFAITSATPPGFGIDAQTGRIRWTTTENDGGRQIAVTVRVTDTGTPAQSATQTFQVTVTESNQSPTIASVGAQRVAAGRPLVLQLSAQDADLPAQALTYSFPSLPPQGMTLDAGSGLLTWQPDVLLAGSTVLVNVTVTDSGIPPKEATVTFPVVVDPAVVDRPPQFYAMGGQIWLQGSTHTLQIGAFDPDGDAVKLTLNATGLPGGVTFASTDGTGLGSLTWNTTGVPPGIYPLPLLATASAQQTSYSPAVKIVADNGYWRWAVEELKDAPEFATSEPTANADLDDASNIFEWALLRSPRLTDSTPFTFHRQTYDGGWVAAELSLHRRRGSERFVTLTPQASGVLDAASWADVPAPDWEVFLDPYGDRDGDPDSEEILFRIWLSPTDPVARKFFRVKAATRALLP